MSALVDATRVDQSDAIAWDIQEEVRLAQQIRTRFHEGLTREEERSEYVRKAVATKKKRVIIPFSAVFGFDAALARRLLADPITVLPPAEIAVSDIARMITSASADTLQNDYVSIKDREEQRTLYLGFTGWLGSHGVTPRGLGARLANKLVCVEGIVTRCSLIHPRLTHATFYIPELQRHFFREHHDTLSITAKGRSQAPVYNVNQDGDGHAVELEYGLSYYKDSQRLTVQEMPEITPTGQLPRTVEIVCEHDLVDAVKPGDRIRVYGVLRALPFKDSAAISGLAKALVIANNVEVIHQEKRVPVLTAVDLKQFREIANRDDTLDVVSQAVAPTISGHEQVKRGLALQLVGGEGKEVEGDGSRLRGDIHVLLVGDPSCGKSQMLRFMLNISPLALSTTGRGSSAVGLTAAVVSDSETGDRRLEAGAMVLADGGLVCIDEFDKMSPDDRVAVHEVMEQQRVSINKAGISATLNARTSVLAAANPIYGLFDDTKDFSSQVNFPDSLLSRFDLIYLIRESASAEQDRKISNQVLAQLRAPADSEGMIHSSALVLGQRANAQTRPKQLYGSTGRMGQSQALATLQPDFQVKKTSGRNKGAAMWSKLPAHMADNPEAANKSRRASWGSKPGSKILSTDFLRKYVQYCRSRPAPILTDEAVDMIADFYAEIRQRLSKESNGTKQARANHAKAIPTPRLLEACVRLSTAHAKLKLKEFVTEDDVAEAKRLLYYTMCGILPEDDTQDDDDEALLSRGMTTPGSKRVAASKRRRERDASEEQEVESAMRDLSLGQRTRKQRRTATAGTGPSVSPVAVTEDSQSVQTSVAADRKDALKSIFDDLQQKYDEQEWEFDKLMTAANKRLLKSNKKVFEEAEFRAAIRKLQVENQLMVVESRVYFI
eukprot:Gregarina_sp_Pseudo_9__1480@NODE_19_length_5871_cov_29_635631_g17_i0_p1_GENE_NODE_19_length_5871_cov_29_635631_g17_i0NODE_19_length_5871_cov_29_635631_g17_i0_p1_ORF_typecomplete_len892_score249_51MCM/PF00493_23/4_5e88MCM_OB/PF17207_3/1_7e27MCM_lid/PF17855_1/3_5e02MCM_lid/PF17855_1/1_9e21Mg_chelatase/PF01078_21/1e09AAA_3/PF07726_11/1_9e06AAA_5/PF07728_14/1e05Sigma54_activat/PF00158_26/2_9e05Sigma54_activ_2/PF14532_6/0_0012RuvB_N/PF05496_12/0_0092MCM_N/PF14551_6/0_025AAA_2/PF07724_14/0_069AAA/PF00